MFCYSGTYASLHNITYKLQFILCTIFNDKYYKWTMLTDFRTCVTSFQQILFGASDDDEDDLRAQLLFLLLLLLHIFKNTEYQKMVGSAA